MDAIDRLNGEVHDFADFGIVEIVRNRDLQSGLQTGAVYSLQGGHLNVEKVADASVG